MGTIIDIACGKKNISIIKQSFENKKRTLLGKTAKANGLVLYSVCYDK